MLLITGDRTLCPDTDAMQAKDRNGVVVAADLPDNDQESGIPEGVWPAQLPHRQDRQTGCRGASLQQKR